jgi:hypothetical protein
MPQIIIAFALGFYVCMYGVSTVLDKMVDVLQSAQVYIEEHYEHPTESKDTNA